MTANGKTGGNKIFQGIGEITADERSSAQVGKNNEMAASAS